MPLSQVSSCLSDPVITVLGVLLPHLAGAVVEKAELAGARLWIWARAQAGQASCPGPGRAGVLPGLRPVLGPGAQPLSAAAGRRDRRQAGGDPADGAAVLLPGAGLPGDHVR
jgi:hypothetical protein